jgi:Transposase zinc-binding domain
MGRPALEVADILREHGPAWRQAQRGHLSLAQLKEMSAITQCRRATLGGQVLRCEGCGTDQVAYNACRNRHCPKCQSTAAKRWLDARQAGLLPAEYCHVVFTLPAPIADLAYQNKAAVYGLLFGVAAKVLQTIAADPKHLGAHRCHAGASHQGLGADAPPPCARRRARRQALAGRQAMGGVPAGDLPVGARVVAAVPPTLRRRAAAGTHQTAELR